MDTYESKSLDHRLRGCAGRSRGGASTPGSGSVRVLVVDPSGDLHGRFSDTLRRAGHEVLPSRRTETVREIHATDGLDLVIVHFDRLDRSDWKPLSVLNSSYPNLAVAAVFSESRPSEILRAVARALGAKRILRMPLDTGSLIDAVKSLTSD
jgi:DNA-binding NtrC family response regulator